MSDETKEATNISSRLLWVITILATIVAAAPHMFFPPPLELHMAGDMQAWLGISIWAPAILAGVAFFFGVEFGTKIDPEKPDIFPVNVVVAVLSLILYLSYLAEMYELSWTQMEAMRPWTELQTALPMYAVLGALLALFWQGFVQHRVMSAMSRGWRIALVTALSAAVYLPFLATGQHDDNGLFFSAMAIEGFIAACVFETGIPTWGIMLLRAAFGIAFIWFQQALLL